MHKIKATLVVCQYNVQNKDDKWPGSSLIYKKCASFRKKQLSPEHHEDKEQKKKEKQRLEKEKKEQKEKNKKRNEMHKKFKVSSNA